MFASEVTDTGLAPQTRMQFMRLHTKQNETKNKLQTAWPKTGRNI